MLKVTISILLFSSIFERNGAQDLRKFPPNFLFGVSTSAYQIEGANADIYGKGENIWDYNIKKNPNIIKNKENADIACDSYHKYREDIELLKSIGVNFYRLSISWTRILPDGYSNNINMQAIEYYNNVINLLVKNGIEPMVTICHGDIPQRIQDLGGWTNPYMAYYIVDYARIVFTYFGDRVKYWITFNSWCYGYGDTMSPPFVGQPDIANYLCHHVKILAHARIYHLYDELFRKKQRGQVGLTIERQWYEPATDKPEDQEAAERARQFSAISANAIYHPEGDYPAIVKSRVAERSRKQGYLRSRLLEFSKEEVEYIQGSYDFFGLNHYTTFLISPTNSSTDDIGVERTQNPEWQQASSFWLKGYPKGLRNALKWIKDSFDNPDIIITENGFSDHGELNDTGRIQYLKEHLEAVLDSIHEDKVSVRGYAVWSLLDNFEWGRGYSEKFGLVHVDFNDPNRTRTPKLSSKWYKKVIAERTPHIFNYFI